MDRIAHILAPTPLPRMVPLRQEFQAPTLANPIEELNAALTASSAAITPGMRIAITVGSRGIAMLQELTKALVDFVHSKGALPFIVPAMGSHGGATAEGQKELLGSLGITEASIGCPILSNMETVCLGKLSNGMPVMVDSNAHNADGIILFNRIKPHNSFRHHIESGLAKMLSIGLGKQSGADYCHAWGFHHMGELVVAMAEHKLECCKILLGVGTIENAYGNIAHILVTPPDALLTREAAMLETAKSYMPRLLFDPLDVLIIDQIGKEFSGGGMDANITGISAAGIVMGPANITRKVVLDVSDHSLGNAIGAGLADITTQRLYKKADLTVMAVNALTSKVPAAARMPIALANDRLAIQAAIKTSTPKNLQNVRVMRIANTAHLGCAYISEALLSEAQTMNNVHICGNPAAMRFSAEGNLLDTWDFVPTGAQCPQPETTRKG